MRAVVVAALLALLGVPAFAETPRIGPYAMGMSAPEADAASPGALRFEPIGASGISIARGEAQFFDAPFDVRASFYWNAGLRTLAIRHSEDVQEPECRALTTRVAAEISRTFDIALPPAPESDRYWDISFRAEEPALGEWHVEWNASWQRGWGESFCYLALRVSGPAPPVVDAVWHEFDDLQPIAGPPVWLSEPSPAQILRLNPPRAVERGQSGFVVLACRVNLEGGALSCAITNEQPQAWGYGPAALRVSRLYRIAPEVGGEPTAGRKLQLVVDFVDVERHPHIGVQ